METQEGFFTRKILHEYVDVVADFLLYIVQIVELQFRRKLPTSVERKRGEISFQSLLSKIQTFVVPEDVPLDTDAGNQIQIY